MMNKRQIVEEQINEGMHLVPTHMQGGIRRYILDGVPPGDFLRLLLSNDLMGCMGRADDANAQAILGWCKFLYSYAPRGCYGSPEAYNAWLNRADPG